MKRTIALLLVLVMCLGLCACGGKLLPNKDSQHETAASGTEGTMTARDPAAILAKLERDAETFEAAVQKEAGDTISKMDDSYESLDAEEIAAFYASIKEQTGEMYTLMKEACVEYYQAIKEQDSKDITTLVQAMKDLYQVLSKVYEDVRATWKGAYEDVQNEWEEILEDAENGPHAESAAKLQEQLQDAYEKAEEAMSEAHTKAKEEGFADYEALLEELKKGVADIAGQLQDWLNG